MASARCTLCIFHLHGVALVFVDELGEPAPGSLHAAFVDFEFEVIDAHSEVHHLNPLSCAVPR